MFRARTMLVFAIVSMTSFLPYNLFMNAHEYFYYKLRNTTDPGVREEVDLIDVLSTYSFWKQPMLGIEPTTDLQLSYEGWFTVTSGISCIFGSALNTVATKKLSNGCRVLSGHLIVLLSLLPTLVYTCVDTDEDQSRFFWLSMFFSSISSFGSMGLIGAGITGLAASFHENHMQLVLIGQALAGICSSLLSIVCQAATEDAILNGQIYFGAAFIWTIASMFCYFYLLQPNIPVIERAEDVDQLVDGGEQVVATEESDAVERDDDIVVAMISFAPLDSTSYFTGWGEILQQSRSYMASTVFILTITRAAFPAIASQVRTESLLPIWRTYFSSIGCFLFFNIFDAIGRIFYNRFNICRQLLQWSVARVLLLLLLLACNVQPRFHSPTLIENDFFFILINMALALSHGVCFLHAYMKGVQSVELSLRETAGSMLALACVVATLAGSMIGVGIATIL